MDKGLGNLGFITLGITLQPAQQDNRILMTHVKVIDCTYRY